MGLDMYLKGKKFFLGERRQVEDGFQVSEHILNLGYWRKHPNLHGYIVENIAEGVDDCQEIELDKEALIKIIEAVQINDLPVTEGFFFGQSGWSDDHAPDVVAKVFLNALEWLEAQSKGEFRNVVYQASW